MKKRSFGGEIDNYCTIEPDSNVSDDSLIKPEQRTSIDRPAQIDSNDKQRELRGNSICTSFEPPVSCIQKMHRQRWKGIAFAVMNFNGYMNAESRSP
jgi:hypothetical protein